MISKKDIGKKIYKTAVTHDGTLIIVSAKLIAVRGSWVEVENDQGERWKSQGLYHFQTSMMDTIRYFTECACDHVELFRARSTEQKKWRGYIQDMLSAAYEVGKKEAATEKS